MGDAGAVALEMLMKSDHRSLLPIATELRAMSREASVPSALQNHGVWLRVRGLEALQLMTEEVARQTDGMRSLSSSGSRQRLSLLLRAQRHWSGILTGFEAYARVNGGDTAVTAEMIRNFGKRHLTGDTQLNRRAAAHQESFASLGQSSTSSSTTTTAALAIATAVATQLALVQARVSLPAQALVAPAPLPGGAAHIQARPPSSAHGDRRAAREPANAIRTARRRATGTLLPALPAGATCTRCFSQAHLTLACQELQRCRQCLQTGHASNACPRPRSAAAVVAEGAVN